MAAISSSLDNIDGFYFEKAKLVWSVRDDTAKIWQFLKKKRCLCNQNYRKI